MANTTMSHMLLGEPKLYDSGKEMRNTSMRTSTSAIEHTRTILSKM